MLAQLTTDPGEGGFHAPKVSDFFPGPIVEGAPGWLTKYTLLVALAVVAIIVYFLVAYRDPKLVPTKKQWIAESVYGFARNNIAKGMIGEEAVRFAPYITTLFVFIATITISNIFSHSDNAVTGKMLGHDFMAFYTAGTFVREGRYQELYNLESVKNFQHALAKKNGLEVGGVVE